MKDTRKVTEETRQSLTRAGNLPSTRLGLWESEELHFYWSESQMAWRAPGFELGTS